MTMFLIASHARCTGAKAFFDAHRPPAGAARHRPWAALIASALLLGACAHRPVPAPAHPAVPAAWMHAASVAPLADAAAAAPHADPAAGALRLDAAAGDAADTVHTAHGIAPAWWRQYREPALDQAVAHALARHGSLAAAALKLRNARLRAEAAGATLLPSASGNLHASARQPLSGEDTRAARTHGFGASLGVAWELDLWGRLATLADMAAFEHQASAFDADATAALLAASVVRQYWQLAAQNQRLDAARHSLEHARRTLALTQAQYEAGAVSGLDLSQARQAVQTQALALLTLTQQRTEMRHALALLLDAPPGPLPGGLAEPARLPPGAAARAMPRPGVPAELLARRPDLRAAHWRLRAALAKVQAERLAFYPAFSLTGALGTSSQALLRILANPVASLGAGLSLPFLNLGELRRNPQIAQNDYEQAVTAYRQSVLTALQEVENALSATATLQQAAQRHAALTAQARHTEALTEVRYRAGAIALRHWLDAQEARRQAEQAEVDAQLQLLLAQAQLYQALGVSAGGAH
ncbi:efflux transporter outer membrane subunit [Comamonadaceae bacterium OH2545_COT-014]|nr:efflux transporter outer membrane subunit [Comamonadaceae bacterium OH2545_COT-014]